MSGDVSMGRVVGVARVGDPSRELGRVVARPELGVLRFHLRELALELRDAGAERLDLGLGRARVKVGPERLVRAPVDFEILEACAARGIRTSRCGVERARARLATYVALPMRRRAPFCGCGYA